MSKSMSTPSPASVDRLPLVLIVDDEVHSQAAIRRTIDEEFRVLTASSIASARELMTQNPVQVILCDQRMPGGNGIDFLQEVREHWPDCVRIVISGYTDGEDIIQGINEAGIFQYILKPWLPDQLLAVVRSAVAARLAQQDVQRLEIDLRSSPKALQSRRRAKLREVRQQFHFDQIERSLDSPLNAVCDVAAKISAYDLSVLIHGESGTGKELIARAMHYASPRLEGPFVVENCAALTDSLLESELFGHKRGSFTGAFDDHIGLFQRASGGTLFLDEIGETTPAFQVKLLRALQEHEVRPVGSTRAIAVNVRILCATHRDLVADVKSGRFREDLYYRLAEVTLHLPPLRERTSDIAPIVQQRLDSVCLALGKPPMTISPAALEALQRYPWPGNIRELGNELARAVALCEGLKLELRDLSSKVLQAVAQPAKAGLSLDQTLSQALGLHGGTLAQRLDAVEATILRDTLTRLGGNKSQAAQVLDISRVGLRTKLARFGLLAQFDAAASDESTPSHPHE